MTSILTKTIVELRVNPSLAFYNCMAEISDKVEKEFPQWVTDRLHIEMRNDEKKTLLYLEHNRVAVVSENSNILQNNYLSIAKKSIKVYLDTRTVKKGVRLGVRSTLLYKLDFSYKEYVSIFTEKFYPSKKTLASIIPGEITDVAFATDFEDDVYKYHFQIAPVIRDEALTKLQLKHEHLITQFSENMILIDIDCYSEKIEVNKIYTDVESMYKRSNDQIEKIIHYALPTK